MDDTISRQAAIAELRDMAVPLSQDPGCKDIHERDRTLSIAMLKIRRLPPAHRERKKMSNQEWIDFLSEQFDVSRTTAKDMLHGLMKCKTEDNFKKQFSGKRKEDED